ncbi:NAD(P)-dependent alcohol dehydrogenase [Streptomyces rochei]|uniref:NAD(P)-dependent alcohol dehydrogenase n=1 Tax=Streptomyces TaxID=1883 RepID=UPI001B37FE72|nr:MULTISPECIES: NAD(P)-dependent alcohol dehydrogenase [Streptomyces]MBQ0880609.1 NAD(P)-dependent alcohol dehydrogenase [Streptomyces sp. RT42]WQC12479.1 NAD(P)-dependent alcohol dehydrogenase [Streptomyces rochei]
MSDMRAALYDGYGPPEVLYEGTVPRPVAAPGEILVRVLTASVNGGELAGRAGKLRPVTGLTGRGFPKRTGMDFVGEVVTPGPPGSGVTAGDRVWGLLPRRRMFGSAAEFVTVPPGKVARAPSSLDAAEAVSLLAGGTTALVALRDKARLRAGERLLVRGAAGGVGSVAVQLGRARGAHVTALAGARNLDFVRDLGADDAFDYATTGPAGLGRFDVVFDAVGTDLGAYRRLLAPGGRMVAIAFDLSRPGTSLARLLATTVYGPRRVRFFSGNPDRALLADLTALVEDGALRPVVDTVHPLSAIADAHRALERGGVRGKHVIRVG